MKTEPLPSRQGDLVAHAVVPPAPPPDDLLACLLACPISNMPRIPNSSSTEAGKQRDTVGCGRAGSLSLHLPCHMVPRCPCKSEILQESKASTVALPAAALPPLSSICCRLKIGKSEFTNLLLLSQLQTDATSSSLRPSGRRGETHPIPTRGGKNSGRAKLDVKL